MKMIETHQINPLIHSVFGEFLGSLIYDGTWVGKDSDIPNYDGIRKDVVDGMKEAGVAAIRWPGGCFADHYYWKDGIGKDRKPRMRFVGFSNLQRVTPNDFGTDEFIKMCRLTGAEPILVCNAASDTPEDFYDWFEYCNADKSTKYGSIRAENGHPEPYYVKIWAIGNTDANVWQVSYNDPSSYARDYLKYQFVIKGGLQDVKLIGLGLSERHETPGWVEGYLDYVTGGGRLKGPDSLSIHHYIGSAKARYGECGDSVDYSDDAFYFTIDALKAYQLDIDLHRQFIKEHTNPKFKTTICFDEWGLWNNEKVPQPGLRQIQTVRDGIFAACCFHLFYRNSDIVELAMETQYSNVLQSLFETDGAKFYKTPTFYVFKMFKDHKGKFLMDFDKYNDNKMLDMIASTSADASEVVFSIVNKDLHKCYKIELPTEFKNYKVKQSSILTSENVRDYNTFEKTEVIKDTDFALNSDFSFEAPKHSIISITLIK